ncbi:uncharacterized protein LOC131248246 [Magnolia sinica]|uniref:uncharacterized protein LOC131248246 n=1 Tax=Magnolia sinica TaxID=86752 RepID=UPI002659F69F|nr:uncharacterized protein LOC131248246 [Magnolia sinica]
MKRSFGNSRSMGSGGMLRAVGRAVGAGIGGVQQSVSTAKPNPSTFFSLSSSSPSPSSSVSFPVSATSNANGRTSSTCFIEDDDWESVEEEDGRDGNNGFHDRFVFGPVPSKDEVEDAISALQQVVVAGPYSQTVEDSYPSTPRKDESSLMTDSTELMCRVSSAEAGSDWIEPVLHLNNPKPLECHGYDNVIDAFWLLQRNPSVQRMVISLSSDNAIWDAVMNNEVVQELRDSFYADQPPENDQQPSSKDTHPEVSFKFLRWILDNTKTKMMELISKIMKLTNDLFQAPAKGKMIDVFEDTVKSSLMLSIMVLLVIVVTRVRSD